MIKLIEEQKESLCKISESTGISKMKLYRYATQKTNLDKMPVSLLIKISSYFNLTPSDFLNKARKCINKY